MIVGLCSSYLEGALVRGAVRSLLAGCDHVVVFEGPAGPPLDDPRIPPSDLDGYLDHGRVTIRRGSWRTDAAKRTAMIEYLRPQSETSAGQLVPCWGVWIDGDEVLMNPEFLRDYLGYIDQREELEDDQVLGWPIKMVESDGTIQIVQAKVIRIDRLDKYSVSSSVFKDTLGQLRGMGNYPASIDDYPLGNQLRQLMDPNGGKAFAWIPAPGEPYIIHRPNLRHPLRSGLRLHHQEAVEIEKFKGGNPDGE